MSSVYDRNADEIDHVVLDCAANGYSRAQIAACIGVPKKRLKEWAEASVRFSEVLQTADTLAQAWWEGQAQSGGANRTIGGTIWHKSMSARFPEDYADRMEQGDIGDTERITKINWKIVDMPEQESGNDNST